MKIDIAITKYRFICTIVVCCTGCPGSENAQSTSQPNKNLKSPSMRSMQQSPNTTPNATGERPPSNGPGGDAPQNPPSDDPSGDKPKGAPTDSAPTGNQDNSCNENTDNNNEEDIASTNAKSVDPGTMEPDLKSNDIEQEEDRQTSKPENQQNIGDNTDKPPQPFPRRKKASNLNEAEGKQLKERYSRPKYSCAL